MADPDLDFVMADLIGHFCPFVIPDLIGDPYLFPAGRARCAGAAGIRADVGEGRSCPSRLLDG